MDKGPPPRALLLEWKCQRYHTLPEPGSMLDQVAGDIDRMAAASNVYNSVRSWHEMYTQGGSMDSWLKYNKPAWEITQAWMELNNGI